MQWVGDSTSNGTTAAVGSLSQYALVVWLCLWAEGVVCCLQSDADRVWEWCEQCLCWNVWQHAAQPV